MVLKQHKCPYCNKDIKFSKVFSIKNDLEYYCSNCHNISCVKLDKKINNWVIALITMCILIVFVFSFLIRTLIIGTFIMVLLFLGFYIFVPNFLKFTLKK